MGCDIHSFVEVKKLNKWELVDDWIDNRSYGWFGFLANVRNYSHVPSISNPKGLPQDISEGGAIEWDNEYDGHSCSYLTLKELLDFNYDQEFEDRRVTRQTGNFIDGSALAEPGEGETITIREFLGTLLDHIHKLKEYGEPENVRVVFWFDN
jgi:hypothetical protein